MDNTLEFTEEEKAAFVEDVKRLLVQVIPDEAVRKTYTVEPCSYNFDVPRAEIKKEDDFARASATIDRMSKRWQAEAKATKIIQVRSHGRRCCFGRMRTVYGTVWFASLEKAVARAVKDIEAEHADLTEKAKNRQKWRAEEDAERKAKRDAEDAAEAALEAAKPLAQRIQEAQDALDASDKDYAQRMAELNEERLANHLSLLAKLKALKEAAQPAPSV